MPTLTITGNYTLTLTDEVILADSTGGPITVTLPPVHPTGKRYYIKDMYGTTDTNPITITATPRQIDNQSSFTLTVDKQAVLAHSDGTNWFIL